MEDGKPQQETESGQGNDDVKSSIPIYSPDSYKEERQPIEHNLPSLGSQISPAENIDLQEQSVNNDGVLDSANKIIQNTEKDPILEEKFPRKVEPLLKGSIIMSETEFEKTEEKGKQKIDFHSESDRLSAASLTDLPPLQASSDFSEDQELVSNQTKPALDALDESDLKSQSKTSGLGLHSQISAEKIEPISNTSRTWESEPERPSKIEREHHQGGNEESKEIKQGEAQKSGFSSLRARFEASQNSNSPPPIKASPRQNLRPSSFEKASATRPNNWGKGEAEQISKSSHNDEDVSTEDSGSMSSFQRARMFAERSSSLGKSQNLGDQKTSNHLNLRGGGGDTEEQQQHDSLSGASLTSLSTLLDPLQSSVLLLLLYTNFL